jgi:hypothetical protein
MDMPYCPLFHMNNLLWLDGSDYTEVDDPNNPETSFLNHWARSWECPTVHKITIPG